MVERSRTILTSCGREIGEAEIAHAGEVASLCRGLSRKELARTLCEHWDWVGATGGLQVSACLKLLAKLEAQGLLRLPALNASQQRFAPAHNSLARAFP